MIDGVSGMATVFGIEIPVLEFLMITNIFMLIYIVVTMFELRNLLKIKEEFSRHLELIEKAVGAETLAKQKAGSKIKYVYKKEEDK